MDATLEARLRQAQSEKQTPIDLVSALVGDELLRRQDRLITLHIQHARFRDAERSLDSFDLDFNKKMNRALIHELATARFVAQREDVPFLGPPGTRKSHLAQALGRAAILQGHRVLYREAHVLLAELADATLDGARKDFFAELTTVPLLTIRRLLTDTVLAYKAGRLRGALSALGRAPALHPAVPAQTNGKGERLIQALLPAREGIAGVTGPFQGDFSALPIPRFARVESWGLRSFATIFTEHARAGARSSAPMREVRRRQPRRADACPPPGCECQRGCASWATSWKRIPGERRPRLACGRRYL